MNKQWVKLGVTVLEYDLILAIDYDEGEDTTTIYTSIYDSENECNQNFTCEGDHVEEFYNILKGVSNV